MDKPLMPKFSETKTDEKDDDPKLSNLYNLVISSAIPVARTWLGYFRSLITTWWVENSMVLPSPERVIWYTDRRLQERLGTHNT